MPRFGHTLASVLVGLLISGAATAQQAEDTYRIQLFGSPETRVVAVGEALGFDVQGVAVPSNQTATESLVRALQRMAFPSEISSSFLVVDAEAPAIWRRAETNVLQFSRRFTLKARRTGSLTIPPVVILLDGITYSTRPQEIRAYHETDELALARRNVVSIVAESRVGGRELRTFGSGFLVANDALVTAYHVVIGADRVRVRFPNGQSVATNKVWAIDPVRDVAILHIDPEFAEDGAIAPLRLSRDLPFGVLEGNENVVFTSGWPDGIQHTTSGEQFRGLQFGSGDVLGVSSNAVRPGDSGGPLLNERGEVVGVVSSGRGTTRERDVLHEDLCLAADPRRALAERNAQDETISLREALLQAAIDSPSGEVIRAATLIMMTGLEGQRASTQVARLASAAERAPNDATLQFLAGSVFQAIGDDERAETSYMAAIEGLADYFPALYALGHMHYQRREFDEAEDLFERTRSYAPYARLGALGLARVYTAKLRYQHAATALAEVLDREPTYAPALYLLGYGHLAEGRALDAEAIAVRLDRIDRGWADALRFHIAAPFLHPSVVNPLPRAEILAN